MSNKITVYYISSENVHNPFEENRNDAFMGRLTYEKVDAYLYIDDAGQQWFMRFLNNNTWVTRSFGAYSNLSLMCLAAAIDEDVFGTYKGMDEYWDIEWEVKGDKLNYVI